MSWAELKAYGDIHEVIAIEKIEKLNNVKCTMRQDDNNFKKMHHDFITSDNIKYEVKADRKGNLTGNCFIEFLDARKKISGIALSDANFYIIYTHDLYLLIHIDKLKEMTINKPIARARDGTKGYIIKWDVIKDSSILI